MPFFPETDSGIGPRVPGGTPPDLRPTGPEDVLASDQPLAALGRNVGRIGEVIGAAGIRQNPVVSAYRYLRDRTGFAYDPNHNPLDIIAGTKYETDYLDSFVASGSEGETRAIMRQIDDEENARHILDSSGSLGFVAQVGAGMADPTIFLPGTVFFKGGKAGWEIARLAGATAAAATLQAGIQEGALYATQETRTPGEVAVNIGSATILGGILGAGAGALLARGEREALTAALSHDRAAMAADLAPQPVGAGAAATDTRQLKLQGYYLDKLPVLREITKRISPTMRIWSSDFVSAKRALADLAETPLRFEDNKAGIATTQGPAVERMGRQATLSARADVGAELDRLYARYRFGKTETGFLGQQVAKARGAIDRASEKMTPLDFRQAVGKAMREGDKSDIPEVAEAAQFIRRRVFEPWKERAIKAGMLPEDVTPETAESYFSRVYNKQKIDAERPRFQKIIADWLESNQANNDAVKEKLSGLADRIDELQSRIEKSTDTREAAQFQAEFDDLMRRVEEEVTNWKGKTSWEAEKAIQRRVEAEADRAADAPRLQSADKAVTRAVRHMLASDTGLSPDELMARAGEIVDRISVGPDGRLPYDAPSGGPRVGWSGEAGPRPRGPLAARTFMIPDALIQDFLVSDVEEVTQHYLRTMVPDVLLTEKFGDVDMTEAFKKLREEHEAMSLAAKSDKERIRLRKEYDAVVHRLAAIRDRVRNVYMADPKMRNMARLAAAAKTYNMITDLGGVTIASLADTAGPIFLHGFGKVFGQAWRPMFKGLTGVKTGFAVARSQYKAMGIAIETQLSARMNDAYAMVDVYRSSSKFERALGAASDAYFNATLLGPWTDMGKTITAVVSGNEIFRAAKAAAEGSASAKTIEKLAASGIDQQMAGRIWRQFEKGGEVIDGTFLPNTADWTDAGARTAFEGAVGRDADMAILTPGQEKPLWMNHPIASLLGQYKSFAAAATERYLIAGLQRSDAQALSGLMAGVTAGMMSYAIYQLTTGRDLSENPADWIREGMIRSGALGWFEEGRGFAERLTGGVADPYRLIGSNRPSSRYASRSALSQLLGPTWSKIEGIGLASGNAVQGNWSAADTRRLRRVVAFNNLFYVRSLFDRVESSVNGLLGVDDLPATPKR